MYLKCHTRRKDGKEHRYWSLMEKRRLADGRILDRPLLYLGEINDAQQAAWTRTIAAFDPATQRPRQWGACWLAIQLWDLLQLGEFWRPRLPDSREGTSWYHLLQVLTVYRLIDPGSEWRLHRDWFLGTALGNLLDEDFALVAKDNPYRCLDRLLAHQTELFTFLQARWKDLFAATFDVLLYDLTSTYFGSCALF